MAKLEAKLGEDAAQLARLALVALLHLAQCHGLALLDAIERNSSAELRTAPDLIS